MTPFTTKNKQYHDAYPNMQTGVEYELGLMEVVDGKAKAASYIPIKKTAHIASILDGSIQDPLAQKYQIDPNFREKQNLVPEKIRSDERFTRQTVMYNNWLDASIGETIMVPAQYGMKLLAFDLKDCFLTMASEESTDPYSKVLIPHALKGIDQLIQYIEPDATLDMVETQSGVSRNIFILKTQLGLILSCLDTLLQREKILDRGAKSFTYETYHASNTLLDQIDDWDEMLTQSSQVPEAEWKGTYIQGRVDGLIQFIRNKGINSIFDGMPQKGYQTNNSVDFLIDPDTQDLRRAHEDINERQRRRITIEQLPGIYATMDAMCIFKGKFLSACANIFGNDFGARTKEKMPYLQWMKTGDVTSFKSNNTPIRFFNSKRTGNYPNTFPDSRAQNGNPDDYRSYHKELYEIHMLNEGKHYLPFFPKGILPRDQAIIEDRYPDIAPRLDYIKYINAFNAALHHHAYRHMNDAKELLNSGNADRVRKAINRAQLETAQFGKATNIQLLLPEQYIARNNIAELLEKNGGTITNGVFQSTAHQYSLATLDILINQYGDREHPIRTTLEELKEMYTIKGSFSEQTFAAIGKHPSELSNEEYQSYMINEQSNNWKEDAFQETRELMLQTPQLHDYSKKYFYGEGSLSEDRTLGSLIQKDRRLAATLTEKRLLGMLAILPGLLDEGKQLQGPYDHYDHQRLLKELSPLTHVA